MSTMLEQAIVDAKSLKEAALKNAENALLEKYSKDIKSAVETLLEAEGDELGGGEEDPMMGMGGEEEVEDTLPGITSAMGDGEELCPCPDNDEEINIDFDQLSAAVDAEEASLEGGDGGLEGLMGDLPADDELDEPGLELQEVFMLEEEKEEVEADVEVDDDEVELDEGSCGDYKRDTEEDGEVELAEGATDAEFEKVDALIDALGDPQRALDAVIQALPAHTVHETLDYIAQQYGFSLDGGDEEEDDMLDEAALRDMIQEILHVDHAPQPSGTIGGYGYTNDAEIEAEVGWNTARMNSDTLAKEEVKEYQKTTKDLKESVRKHKVQTKKYAQKTKRYAEAVNTLKQKLDETTLSNAKLLYMNKVLNSGSLNERQSKKIVEAISKAKSVNEAKVIYETLQSTVGSVERKATAPKSLSEAVAKKPAFLPRRQPKPAPSGELTRWHVLAGLGDKK